MKQRTWGILSLFGLILIFIGVTSCDSLTMVEEPVLERSEQVAGVSPTHFLFRPTCRDGRLDSGAKYKICVPRNWNRELVVYAPGYRDPNLEELEIRDDEIGDFSVQEIVNNLGFAFATTSYHKNGLPLTEEEFDALDDLTQLVELTEQIFRRPLRKSYLTGPSLGGLVSVLGIETLAETFDAALAACGPYGDFRWQLDYFGDFRVVFDALFANEIVGWPIWTQSDVEIDKKFIDAWNEFESKIRAAIAADLDNDGALTNQLLEITGAPVDPTDDDTKVETVVDILWHHVHGTNDAIEVLEGQPYDNIGRNFNGLVVEKFSADPLALDFIDDHYQTSGELQRPLVTLHTDLDPVNPVRHQQDYNEKANPGILHTPITVTRYGHCNFTLEEVLAAFSLMILKSTAQDLLVSTSVLPEAQQQQLFLNKAREIGASPQIVTPEELKRSIEPHKNME
ncbi:MAG: hypothetical protein ACFCU6_05615 [Balneolaceae bacterium]